MSCGSQQQHQSPQATFVVVANRLPVDRVENPDGSADWRPSPGGLVTAFEPVMHRHEGAWVGWHGAPDEELEPFEHDGLQLVPVALSSQEVADYYEGFSNGTLWPLYHDVIATPEFHREWWDAYVTGQPALRRSDRRRSRARAPWSGCRTTSSSWCRRCCASSGPTCGSASSCTSRSRRTELFLQLPWRDQILEGLLGADLVGFQLPGGAQNFVRLVRQRLQLETRRDRISLADGREVVARAYPIAIDAKGLNELAGTPGGRRAGRRDPARSRRPQDDLPRRRPARLHQGPAGADPRLRRADRRGQDRRRTRPSWSSWPSRRGSGSTSTASSATTSTGWSAGSTATSAGSAGRRSPTCTPRTRGRRWRRSTARPTSWWSPRCATG